MHYLFGQKNPKLMTKPVPMSSLSIKRFLPLICCCCFISVSISAQQYPKYIVVFKNKNNSPYHLNDAQQYLSPRSIQRR